MTINGVKPIVLISACLLGKHVRYDGQHQKLDWLSASFKKSVIFIPLCPEVEMGLGVPRDTLRLVGKPAKMIVKRTGRDLTAHAQATSLRLLERLPRIDGCILKSRSPSCGLRRVKRYSKSDKFSRTAQGLFATELKRADFKIPLVDETQLRNPAQRIAFFAQVYALAALRHAGDESSAKNRFHRELKPILLLRDLQSLAKRVGKPGYQNSLRLALQRAPIQRLKRLLPRLFLKILK